MSCDDAHDGAAVTSPRQRRASLQTAFFSLPTTSEFFREIKFKPTKIIGVLFLTEPEPDVERVRSRTVDQLLKYRRFASNVSLEEDKDGTRHVIFNLVQMDQIDLGYHFTVIDGKGTFTEGEDVSEMVSEAHLLDWDQFKPLWKLTLVTNMKDGRSMLFCVVDHTIGDGATMSAVLVSLFDGDDQMKTLPEKAKPTTTAAKKGPGLRLSHQATNMVYACCMGTVGLLLGPTDPVNCLTFSKLERRATPKGKKCSQTKHFPLEEMKAIKNRLPGATLNDVVTAVVTIAIRRYYEKTHYKIKDANRKGQQPMQLMFAINYRPPTTTMEELRANGGSNRVVAGNFHVPLDFTSPIDAVWRCKSRMDIYKTTPIAKISWHFASFLISKLSWKQLEEAALTVLFKPTGIISNMMGPTHQASIGGYIIDDFSFYGTAPGQGFYLGIISYNSRVRISVSMDRSVEANPGEFKDCLEWAYDQLKKDVDQSSPSELAPPDTTPLSARMLEYIGPVVLIALAYLWVSA